MGRVKICPDLATTPHIFKSASQADHESKQKLHENRASPLQLSAVLCAKHQSFIGANVLLNSLNVKKIAQILMWLTLWCDLNLILGVILTGNYGNVKTAAVIKIGDFSVNSSSPGGSNFILFISIWTGALAISGLLALRKSPIKHILSTS